MKLVVQWILLLFDIKCGNWMCNRTKLWHKVSRSCGKFIDTFCRVQGEYDLGHLDGFCISGKIRSPLLMVPCRSLLLMIQTLCVKTCIIWDTTREIADQTWIPGRSVERIIHGHLRFRNVSAGQVPKQLNLDQWDCQKVKWSTSEALSGRGDHWRDSNLWRNFVTQHAPKSKTESWQCKHTSSHTPRTVQESTSFKLWEILRAST
jgi:hypothetical protein